jgi:hypothetical protein
MDGVIMSMKEGATGEFDFSKSFVLAEPPSLYAKRNRWYGASSDRGDALQSPRSCASRSCGPTRASR